MIGDNINTQIKKKRIYPKDFDLNNELYSLSCEKEKVFLTGDKEEDKKKLETTNSNEKNKLNIMDQKNYSLISFITSTKLPDLYHRYCFTSGNEYSIINSNDNDNENEKNKEKKIKINNNDSESESSSNLLIKNKNIRYFTFNYIKNYKCTNCGEIGHMSLDCPYDNIIYCLKCNKKGHEEKDCIFLKCFKCNKFGHRNFECPIKENNLNICTRCFGIGHKNEECIKDPIYPSINYYNFNNFSCPFCGSKKHLVCPIQIDYNYDIVKEDSFNDYTNDNNNDLQKLKNNNNDFIGEREEGEIIHKKNYFNDMNNCDIARCIFCPICGERHSINQCREYLNNKDKYRNKFDEQRENYVKNFLFKNNRNYRNNSFRGRDNYGNKIRERSREEIYNNNKRNRAPNYYHNNNNYNNNHNNSNYNNNKFNNNNFNSNNFHYNDNNFRRGNYRGKNNNNFSKRNYSN